MIISLPAVAVPDSALPLATLIDANVSSASKTNSFKNVFDALTLSQDSQDSSDAGQESRNLPNGSDKKDVSATSVPPLQEPLAITDPKPALAFKTSLFRSLSAAAPGDSQALNDDETATKQDGVAADDKRSATAATAESDSLSASVSPLIAPTGSTSPNTQLPATHLQQAVVLRVAPSAAPANAGFHGPSPLQDQPVEISTARLTPETNLQMRAASPKDQAAKPTDSTAIEAASIQPNLAPGSTQSSTAQTSIVSNVSKAANNASELEPVQPNTARVKTATQSADSPASSPNVVQSSPIQDRSIPLAKNIAATTLPIPTQQAAAVVKPASRAAQTAAAPETQSPAMKVAPQGTRDVSPFHPTVASGKFEIAPTSLPSMSLRTASQPTPAASIPSDSTPSTKLANRGNAQSSVATSSSVAVPSVDAPAAPPAVSHSVSQQAPLISNRVANQSGIRPVADPKAAVQLPAQQPQSASPSAPANNDSTSSDAHTAIASAPAAASSGAAVQANPTQAAATPTTVSSAPASQIAAAASTTETARQAPVPTTDFPIPAHQVSTVVAEAKSALLPKAEDFAFAARIQGMDTALETVSSSQLTRPVSREGAEASTSSASSAASPAKNSVSQGTAPAPSNNEAPQSQASTDTRHNVSETQTESDKTSGAGSASQAPSTQVSEQAPHVANAPVLPVQQTASSIQAEPVETTHTSAPLIAHESHLLAPEMPKASTGTEILLHLTDGDQSSAAIRVADRAGAVSVSVHASDPTLRESLRSNLDDLSSQLNSQGWKADIVKTAAAASHSEAQQDPRSGGERSSQQQQQSSGSDRQSQRDRRGNGGRWQQEFDQQITGSDAHAGGKA